MTTELQRIASVSPTSPGTLAVLWRDGRTEFVDLSGWIATGGEILKPLQRVDVFATAAVSDYGAAVQWGDDDDLAIDAHHLSRLALLQRPLGADGLRDWQERIDLSNNEAADFFDVALSTWNLWRASGNIPRTAQTLCRAAELDPDIVSARLRPRKAGRPAKA